MCGNLSVEISIVCHTPVLGWMDRQMLWPVFSTFCTCALYLLLTCNTINPQ